MSKYGISKWLPDGRRNPAYWRAQSAAAHAANPNKRKEYQRLWRRANPHKSRECSQRYRARHPDKVKAFIKEYRARMQREHPEVVARWHRHGQLKKYGMRPALYYALMDSQKKKCAICGRLHVEEKRKRLQVDHDHKTGKIRGLLCQDCNAGIGCLREDPKIFKAALGYLRKHR